MPHKSRFTLPVGKTTENCVSSPIKTELILSISNNSSLDRLSFRRERHGWCRRASPGGF